MRLSRHPSLPHRNHGTMAGPAQDYIDTDRLLCGTGLASRQLGGQSRMALRIKLSTKQISTPLTARCASK
jgi:hypothetical protein